MYVKGSSRCCLTMILVVGGATMGCRQCSLAFVLSVDETGQPNQSSHMHTPTQQQRHKHTAPRRVG